jgi:hypothetical protein
MAMAMASILVRPSSAAFRPMAVKRVTRQDVWLRATAKDLCAGNPPFTLRSTPTLRMRGGKYDGICGSTGAQPAGGRVVR